MAYHLPIAATGRIGVVRSLPGLGDLLCSVPALRALRAAFPAAHITLLGLPGTQWFAERFHTLVDDWLAFPGFPGIPEGWRGAQPVIEFLARMQANPFDLAIQMHGNGSYMNAFTQLLRAQQVAGFYVPGQFCPDPDTFLPYPEHESEIGRMLRLMEFLGVPSQGNATAFPLTPADQIRYRQLAARYGLQRSAFVCLHAGANDESRRWSVEGFAQVADQLAIAGYRIVLTGTAAEQPLVQSVMQAMQTPALNLAGQTDLGTLAVLLRQSALVICNDTGVSHLAAALKAPSVVIFSNSEVQRWAPLNRDRHRVVDRRELGIATAAAVLSQAFDLLGQMPKAEATVMSVGVIHAV
ncbi:MAG TPA: glycosyltransferase family 9 protein [Leptolyngbyaceae cyanobacterium]